MNELNKIYEINEQNMLETLKMKIRNFENTKYQGYLFFINYKTVQIKFFFGNKSPIHLFFYDFSTVDPRLQGISIHNRQY